MIFLLMAIIGQGGKKKIIPVQWNGQYKKNVKAVYGRIKNPVCDEDKYKTVY